MNERRDALPGPRSDAMLEALVAILDIVVLERLAGGAFKQMGNDPPPSWFAQAFRDVDPGAPVTLQQAFPVLDSFLSEAEAFWSSTAYGRLDGEAFVVSGPEGRNLPLSTIAVAFSGRHYLLIQRVPGFDDRQHILQRAREQALAQELVVKRIDALRAPFDRLAALTGQLDTAADLTEPVRGVVTGMTTEIETIRRHLEELPKLPRGRTPRRP
jgi:hypothetical protein